MWVRDQALDSRANALYGASKSQLRQFSEVSCGACLLGKGYKSITESGLTLQVIVPLPPNLYSVWPIQGFSRFLEEHGLWFLVESVASMDGSRGAHIKVDCTPWKRSGSGFRTWITR